MHYEPEKLLSGLTPEQRLIGLSAEDRESLAKWLLKEQRGDLPPDDAS